MLSLGLSLPSIAVMHRVQWDPASLLPVTFLDMQDLSTMRQEITGASATTPAAVDSPVGSWRSKGGSGENWFVAPSLAKRPILRRFGGIYALQWDGVDDCMICADAFPTGRYVAGAMQSIGATFAGGFSGILTTRGTIAQRYGRILENGNTGWSASPLPSSTRKNGVAVTPSNTCFSPITERFVFDAVNAVGREASGLGRDLGTFDEILQYRMFAGYTWSFVELSAEPSSDNRLKLEAWLAGH